MDPLDPLEAGNPFARHSPALEAVASAERVIPVSALNRAIARSLERQFPLSWIGGEISNFTRAASGHWYFSIKDAQAQIRCVMFRQRAQYAEFMPREGDRIEVRATVSMYEPRGELQLGVEAIRRTGQGRLYELFLQLKRELEREGLFDPARKRALPSHPRAIGVVTSLQAAALRDVLTTLARRAPHVPVIVYPTPVQGAGAAEKLAAMLARANQRAEVDVLILCRGGGSIEDLWAFNEAVLARAIVASALPVVAGVGHETDVTIADFAADVRAPTPTAAAEMVSPDRVALLRDLDVRHAHLARSFGREVERRSQQLDWLARRLVSPRERLTRQRTHLTQLSGRLGGAGARRFSVLRERLEMLRLRWGRAVLDTRERQLQISRLDGRLEAAMQRYRERNVSRLEALAARVELLGPRQTLARGYAALIDPASGKPVRSPFELQGGRPLLLHLAEGSVDIELARSQPRLDAPL